MNATAEMIEISEHYTPEEHERWRILSERQMSVLEDHACPAFREGLDILGITPEIIPDLGEVEERLYRETGWRIVRVDRAMKNSVWLCKNWAQKLWPVCPWLRPAKHMEFAPSPDISHDRLHLAVLGNRGFASFVHRLGIEGVQSSPERCKALVRLYFRTGETGLIHTEKGLRIYGAALASSHGEAAHCLGASAKRLPFNVELMMKTPIDDGRYQDAYFEIESFEQLARLQFP